MGVKRQTPREMRGLMPLVAREPNWPRFRAGVGTLAAITRLPSGQWARTLALSELLREV